MNDDLAGFALLATLLTIAPGQDTLLVLRNATLGGVRAGVSTTAGICSGLFLHATLSAAGVSAILATSAEAFAALKLVGAAYLAWLGLQSLLRARAPRLEEPARADLDTGTALRQGLLSNVLNPKTATFYLALLPQFVSEPDHALRQSLALGGVHFLISFAWLAALSAFVAQARGLLARPRVRQAVDGITGLALLVFGLRLALARRS